MFVLCSVIDSLVSPVSYCAAKSISDKHTDIDHAKTISAATDYETTIPAAGFHYYCLRSQDNSQDMVIRISSEKAFSFSFQLFDEKGTFCAPDTYTLDPVNHILQICYTVKSSKSYLLGLQNTGKSSVSYTIYYSTQTTKTTSKPKSNTKKKTTKTTAKPKKMATPKLNRNKQSVATAAPKYDKRKQSLVTAVPRHTATPKATKTTSKKISKTTAKPTKTKKPKKQKTTTSYTSLKLSHTFLQVKQGEAFSLQVPDATQKTKTLQWGCTNATLIKKKSTTSGSFSATAVKKGTLIITCKQKGSKTVAASCTVKIS
jgi:hypothetical protein